MTRLRHARLRHASLRHEIRALLRLSPVLLVLVTAVVMLWQVDLAASPGLLQSSPVETPTGLPATPTFGPPSTLTPTVVIPGIVSPTVPVVLETPTLALPTDTATPTATAAILPPTSTPAAPPTIEPSVEPTGSQAERYPEENAGLRFDWSKLFDSTALLLSGIWLCCGVLLFLAIPVAFVVLWVVSKRRQEQEG